MAELTLPRNSRIARVHDSRPETVSPAKAIAEEKKLIAERHL